MGDKAEPQLTDARLQLSHFSYRSDIDGIRAIAVISVVIYHAFPNLLKGGFIGVDIFFVISGYLISSIIILNLNNKNFCLANFYAKRIVRIFPALILVLFFCLGFGWVSLLANEYSQLGKHVAGGASFVSNLILWGESGYFDRASELKPLLHLWSLGIEEQFYAIWPIIILACLYLRLNIFLASTTIFLASIYLNIYLENKDLSGSFYLPITRSWELMLGCMLAHLAARKKEISKNYQYTGLTKRILYIINLKVFPQNGNNGQIHSLSILSIFSLALIIFSFFNSKGGVNFTWANAFIPTAATAFLIYSGKDAWANRIILSNKIAIFFGKISYPLYLWHWPLLSFARIVESENPSIEYRMSIVCISVLLAWVTYKFLENPLRTSGQTPKKIYILSLLMAIIGIMGYATYKHAGFPNREMLSRFPSPIERLKEDDPSSHKMCLDYYGLTDEYIRYCRLSIHSNNRPKIALIGDSQAAALFYGLSKELNKINEGLVMIGGRLFLDVAAFPNGDEGEVNIYKGGIVATKFIAKERSIDTVIMATAGPFYINGEWNFYLLNQPEITDKTKVFEVGLRNTLDAMVTNGKKVFFLLDIPELTFDPEKCQTSRPLSTKRSFDCSISKESFASKHEQYRALVLNVLKDYPTVTAFDQASYLCDKEICQFKFGDSVLYGNINHLSARGSEFMAKELINVLNVE